MVTMNEHRPEEDSFECTHCYKTFVTLRGLRVHLGKVCRKKNKQCRSSDRKTRSKSSQEEHHSGLIDASVSSPSNQRGEDFIIDEVSVRRQKVLWPAANDKDKYKKFEEKVCEELDKDENNINEGSAKDMLSKFSNIIYRCAVEEFGINDRNKKVSDRKGGLSRRDRRLGEIRKQKRELLKDGRRRQ